MMAGILDGIRVLEVAEYAMVAAGAAALADWGAEVIKVEHAHRGDPIRGITSFGVEPGTGGFSFLWEPFNRSKRCIGIDLTTESGHQVVLDLAANADVFMTSYLPGTRKKLGIDLDDIWAVNPSIIYARGSAHGPLGDEADKGGYDSSTYWFRSGVGSAATPEDSLDVVALPAPAFGDSQTGLALAAGVCGALFQRERTGKATVVDTSLMATSAWAMQASLVGANLAGRDELPHRDRTALHNPLGNTYRTADGRFVVLSMLQADRHWGPLCRALGREDLVDQERFATMQARTENSRACIAELDAIFSTKTLDEWGIALAEQDGPWSPVQRVGEMNADPQLWANGYLRDVDYGEGRHLTMVSAPVQFDEEAPDLRPAPEHAEHTEAILLELGRSWEEILALKEEGAIT
jgi:crotonobetainyl-CoA:carnitine CoA-transferase CaiB-like acyl-CoA transferase